MEAGPSGQNGGNVPGPAAVDSILDQEPVPIPARNMVGKTVREDLMRLGLVTRRLAQVKNLTKIKKKYRKIVDGCKGVRSVFLVKIVTDFCFSHSFGVVFFSFKDNKAVIL